MRHLSVLRRAAVGTLLLALLISSFPAAYAALPTAEPTSIPQEPAPDPPATGVTNPFPLSALLQSSLQIITITDNGPQPATLDVFGPTDVTWRNTTAVTLTLRSGEPVIAPAEQKLFLPSVSRSSATSSRELNVPKVQAAQVTFDIALPPNATFSQRFTAPGEYRFHLVERPEQTGTIRASGTALLATSPAHSESGIASTRETLLTFSGPIEPSTVTTATVRAASGGQNLAARLHISQDKQRVTLFYADPLPGSARVDVYIDGDGLQDAGGTPVDVDGDGVAGGKTTLSFDTLSLTVIPGTKVCGTVYASELGTAASGVSVDVPLHNATITVDGLEAELRTTSDASGNFCLDPAPAGRFFVHVDGRTASNPVAAGAYYPFVGKSWTSTPSAEINVGDIYLPLVVPGTLQPVSATEDTVIRFPQSVLDQFPDFTEVAVTVPAGSLINTDGTPGGRVGIAPVPPDRLPGTLPPGLEFALVITVQTDGAGNFDTPAPVCFPNLPNPTTGKFLEPGDASSIWSFNHDSGRFELSGSATVTADGRLVCSDPGVGIVAPGWHGQTAASVGVKEEGPSRMPPFMLRDLNTAFVLCEIAEIRGIESCAASVTRNAVKRVVGDTIPLCYGGRNPWCDAISALDDLADLWELDDHLDETRNEFEACISQYAACEAAIHDPQARVHQPNEAAAELVALLSESFAKEEKLRAFQAQSALVLGDSASQDDLSPGQTAELEGLLAGLKPLFGDAVPRDVMRALYANIDRLAAALATQGNLYLPETAYYSLENQETGGIERGRTEKGGGISNLILRPNTVYRLRLLFPSDFTFGESRFRSNQAGQITKIPRSGLIPLLPATVYGLDSDNDELLDVAEFVIGTSTTKADTDDDGIGDGAEVAQGSDPLSGILARTGIVASADTPGAALELCIHENLAAVADSAAGVALFNVFNRTTPTLINQIPAPGKTVDVACAAGRVVAVGDGGYVSIFDVSDPANPQMVHQVNTGAAVRAVAVAGGVAYVGDASGRLLAFDIQNGGLLGQQVLDKAVGDVAAANGLVYVLVEGTFHVYSAAADGLNPLASAPSPGKLGNNSQRLFVGPNSAFATHLSGYNTFALPSPAAPALVTAGETAQLGWKFIAPNGSGIGVAVVGPNNTGIPRDISLYDVSDPTQTNRFLTTVATPGEARALVIHNGLAFVADGNAGLQVINYLADDSAGQPPTLTLTSNATGNAAEEGQLLQVLATVADDVQVRHVRFAVNGQVVASDGSFPFSHEMFVARNAAAVTVQATAFDTGGNASAPQTLNLTVTPDSTPPQITRIYPVGGAPVLQNLTVYFDEPVNPATINATSLALVSAGGDGLPGTGDDMPVPGGIYTYRSEAKAAVVSFPGRQASANVELYQLTVSPPLADSAGNLLAAPITHTFRAGPGSFWVNETSGGWDDPFHWSGQQLPPDQAVVFIDVPGEIVVTHNSGTTALASLFSAEEMEITGGSLQVSGGIHQERGLLMNGGTLHDSILHLTPGAVLEFSKAPFSVLRGMTVDGDIRLAASSARAKIEEGLTFTGTMTVDGSANFIGLSGSQTIQGGTILITKTASSWGLSGAGAEVILAQGTTVQGGPLSFSNGTGGQHLVNAGLIQADLPGKPISINVERFTNTGIIRVTNGGTAELNRDWSNSGTLQLESGTLQLDGSFSTNDIGTLQRTGGTVLLTGDLDNSGAVLLLDSPAESWVVNGGHISGGTVRLRNGAALNFGNQGRIFLTGVTLDGDLTVGHTSNARLNIAGGLTISGTLEMGGVGSTAVLLGSQMIKGGTILITKTASSWLLSGAGTEVTLAHGLTVRGGRAKFSGGTGSQHLINEGVMQADLTGQPIELIVEQITNRGRMEATSGKLVATGTLTNSGQLAPGRGGVFALTGSFVQTSGGQLEVVLGGSTPGTGFSQLTVTGAASLGGTLAISLSPGFDPALGATFQILSAGSRTGTFATVNGAAIGGGKALQVDYTAGGVTLTVVTAP